MTFLENPFKHDRMFKYNYFIVIVLSLGISVVELAQTNGKEYKSEHFVVLQKTDRANFNYDLVRICICRRIKLIAIAYPFLIKNQFSPQFT